MQIVKRTDCDFQKLRVSKYKVISDITDTRKELNTPVYEANKPIYGSNDDDGYVEGEDYDYEEPSSCDEDFDYDVEMSFHGINLIILSFEAFRDFNVI